MQSVKNAAMATGSTVGFDAGKLVKSCKRLVLIDTMGKVLASWVAPVGQSDAATAIAFIGCGNHPVAAAGASAGGDNSFADHLSPELFREVDEHRA